MRIDLHTHSTASDGTDAPSELVGEAREAGLDVVALTDHDTFGGWAEAVDALPAGLTLVRGAELSCRLGHISLHLLALLPDPDDEDLAQEMALSRDDRVPRAREMVRRLAEDGWPVSWESVLAQTAGEGTSIGRPHIADALVAGGAVPDRSAAFADILHSRSRYYVPHHATDPVLAVRLVRAAGGVPVFAHPRARRRGPVVGDDTIAAMAEAGLAAVEVDHRDQDDADRAHVAGLARELGLLATGSSDFHGEGKPNRLGENTTDPEVYEALLAQVRSGLEPVRG